jgi:GT2 family glycosyltransferase
MDCGASSNAVVALSTEARPVDTDLPAGTATPHVSVIVPTWNGARFLPPCLDSLRVQTLPARERETIVVDNGSQDDTAEVLRRYPEVRVVSLPTNLGFAGGVNAGIRAARGEVIVLLNNDTECHPRWLEMLLSTLELASDVGMAASKLLLFDRRDTLHNTGDFVDRAGRPHNRGVWEPDDGQWDDQLDVFGPCAAAAAYRRGMLEEVGLFEERFGSYLEDVDLAWRSRLAGWRCLFAPEAVVYHHVSATGGGPVASYHVARNRTWLIARNYPLPLLLRNFRLVAADYGRELGAALRAWRGAAARATLRGLLVGLVTWPLMIPARRRIQASRVISDEALNALMPPGSEVGPGTQLTSH